MIKHLKAWLAGRRERRMQRAIEQHRADAQFHAEMAELHGRAVTMLANGLDDLQRERDLLDLGLPTVIEGGEAEYTTLRIQQAMKEAKK